MDIEQTGPNTVSTHPVTSMDTPVTSGTKESDTVGAFRRSPSSYHQRDDSPQRRYLHPEALRMAPGLDVAQINSSMWAISSRGFNGPFADKLLVLIDGRTVYSPISTGVNWDVQDVLLEDIDRIEVIRGPRERCGGQCRQRRDQHHYEEGSGYPGRLCQRGRGNRGTVDEAARYGGQIGGGLLLPSLWEVFRSWSVLRSQQAPPTTAGTKGHVGFRTRLEPSTATSRHSVDDPGDHYVGTSGSDSARTLIDPPISQPLEERSATPARTSWLAIGTLPMRIPTGPCIVLR